MCLQKVESPVITQKGGKVKGSTRKRTPSQKQPRKGTDADSHRVQPQKGAWGLMFDPLSSPVSQWMQKTGQNARVPEPPEGSIHMSI